MYINFGPAIFTSSVHPTETPKSLHKVIYKNIHSALLARVKTENIIHVSH